MKKLFAVLITAAVLTACNSNADSSSNPDSSNLDSGSMTPAPAPASIDTGTLKTDTTGPRADSTAAR
ncbi:MAG: hypothetical protein INR73_21075 [Williamsia sp.]|nr:hypothetical protein [Williamsia sp.]